MAKRLVTEKFNEEKELDLIRERVVKFITQFLESPTLMTQEEFSKLSGIHRNRISFFMNGKAVPNTGEILRLCRFCGASADVLLTGKASSNQSLKKDIERIEKQFLELKKKI